MTHSLALFVAQASPQSDDGVDKAGPDRAPHDNGVSVRHIVTEIEAICHPAPSSSSLPPPSHSPPPVRSEHPPEAEAPEAATGPPTPPSHPQSPSMLPRDWPAGSVRRAADQLEQKLKQEMETAASQRSPLHSPSAEQPPVRLSPCPPSAEPPPLRSPRDRTEQWVARGEAADEGERTGSRAAPGSSDTDDLPDPSRSPDSDISRVPVTVPAGGRVFTSTEESSLDASAQSQRRRRIQPLHTQDASHRMSLDGAAAQESDTAERMESGSRGGRGGCGCDAESRLARGSQELERIQRTLRELQAFLHEGVGPETTERPRGPRDVTDTEPEPCDGSTSEQTPRGPEVGRRRERQEGQSFLEPIAWRRAMELEARIRQAGLTPPSLMKRSASLAKLDRLELSANDLSDMDLRTHTRAPAPSHSQDSFSASASHPDDTWKKQKVLARHSLAEGTGSPRGGFPSSSSSPSLFLSPSAARRSPKDDTGEREEPGGAVAPARQQGVRGHAARRSRKGSAEKKQQRVAVLYNTM